MGNTLWKPMPGYSGYEINRKGRVRNLRGYELASGKRVALFIGGKLFWVGRQRLLDLAAEVFSAGSDSGSAPDTPAGPVDEIPLEITGEVTLVATVHKPYAHPHPTRERMRQWIDPENKLPMRDPWADGSIEADSHWELVGVM